MVDYERMVKKWMKDNNIEFTKERYDSLVTLMFEVENDAYNDGIHKPRW